MPYWSRPAEWEKSKAAYRRLYPDLDLEFSICDDGSTPPLRDPDARITRLPMKMQALNPCVPINLAVRNSIHDVIVLTNPEIEHRERVLDQMLEALEGENDYVMAACRDTRRGDWYAGAPRTDKPIRPPGTEFHFCVMFHRALFERAGGFDEEYRLGHGYDDNDWLFRLWQLGDVNFKSVPGVVWHCKDIAQRSLWRGHMLLRNEALFKKKWGHTAEYQACVS